MAIIIWVAENERDLEAGRGQRALITTEAQAVLKLNEKAFRELLTKGEITPYEEKLGNYTLYLARDVEELRQKRLKRF